MDIKKILEDHVNWLNGNGGERADLSYSNLSGADLRGANLRGANLSYSNLSGANLSGADLRVADLSYSNLSYANLRYADLRVANLSDADLRYADLRVANLSGADLRGAKNFNYCTGNKKEICSMHIDTYDISFSKEILNIGYETHAIEEWKNFDDETISKIGSVALEWWNKWKEFIFVAIELKFGESK